LKLAIKDYGGYYLLNVDFLVVVFSVFVIIPELFAHESGLFAVVVWA